MKELYTVIKNELKENENIFISTKTKMYDSTNLDNEWWKMEEFTFDQLFNNYSGKEKVYKYWHEDGLCIILKK